MSELDGKLRVMLVDDHALVRSAVRQAISAPDVELVGEAAEADRLVERERPFVVDRGVDEPVAEAAGPHPRQRVVHEDAAVPVALLVRRDGESLEVPVSGRRAGDGAWPRPGRLWR